MGIRPHLPLSGCSGLSASITSMGVRKGVVTATLAVATLLVAATGCATDTCACQYPSDEPEPSESTNS
jgi:hypothetical protein